MKKSLPSSFLIIIARYIWQLYWRIMMSQLAPSTKSGEYNRPTSQFRLQTITPEKNRYRLYIGLSCPWAHRTLITHKLKGLENIIDICLVSPSPEKGGWIMKEISEDCQTIKQLYHLAETNYSGRYTVPILWDIREKKIINNESSEIIVILNDQFNEFARNASLDLNPAYLKAKIDFWNEKVYHSVNNGVYLCGFAQTQNAYNESCLELFKSLDEIDQVLSENIYLCGNTLTLADIRLFTTLIRFDAVYYHLFKCSLKRIVDYKNINRYLTNIYNLEGIAETCDLETIKKDYYLNLFPLNPSGIIPLNELTISQLTINN